MILNRDAQSRTNEITVLKVETVQFVTGLLRIHDIFIDYKSGTLGVVGNALTNLAVGWVSMAYFERNNEIDDSDDYDDSQEAALDRVLGHTE